MGNLDWRESNGSFCQRVERKEKREREGGKRGEKKDSWYR